MLYCFSGTIYDVITSLICIIQKCKYLQNEKKYSKKENTVLLYFEKAFQISSFYFLLHRHFKRALTVVITTTTIRIRMIMIMIMIMTMTMTMAMMVN